MSLQEKHKQEAQLVQGYNREEFQEFTANWDIKMEEIRELIAQ